jgi:hypothetical protein
VGDLEAFSCASYEELSCVSELKEVELFDDEK